MSTSEKIPFKPWLKTLSSLPAGAGPGPAEVLGVPPQDLKPRHQGLGLTTPMQPEQLGMNWMYVGSSLHFPCWA